MKFFARLAPVLIFLTAFALYLSTLAPGMLRGDSGEFQWAMVSLNVAHATGYPLFTLLGYVWQFIPLANNIAWQLNLLAPFFAALAVAALFIFIRALTARPSAALVGALFFALAPVTWFNASILEVYSFHAFLLTLLLYFLWRWSREPKQNAFLYLAFFVLGLAFAHHRLIILALPAILVWLLLTDRRFFLNLPRLALCALLVIPGLLLYLYVPMRLLPEGFSFDYAFYDIILGREYASSLLREINPIPVLVEIPFQNFQLGLLLALSGALVLFRRARHLNIALWLVFLADVLFALVYSVPDVQVFLTSAFVVIALWIGAGSAFLLEWVASRVPASRARYIQIPLTVLLLFLPFFSLLRWNEIQTAVAAEAAPEARARAIASSPLPQGAYLELDWETATALRFLQSAEHLRPDLDARLIHMDRRDEFWRTLENADSGRPVFVEKGIRWTRAPAGFITRPAANDLIQLIPTPFTFTHVDSSISDAIQLLGYSSQPESFTIYWQVKQPVSKDLATYVHFLDANGEKLAQDDHAACCEALYGFRTSEWEPDRAYADVFKPAPPGAKSFAVGMYENLNGDIESYGETVIKP